MATKKELKNVEKYLKSHDNQALISCVHTSFYGPLRSCHFIVKTNINELLSFLDNQMAEDEEQYERLKKGNFKEDEYVLKALMKIHELTGMAVQFMLLPWETTAQMEMMPTEVSTFKEGVNLVLSFVEQNPLSKDPWYYRQRKL